MVDGEPLVNQNVRLADLQGGLALLRQEVEPTLYICPEATLLTVEDNAVLMQAMLLQCREVQTAISVFDIIGGKSPDSVSFTDDIEVFRQHTGVEGLSYGTAYFPFVATTMMQPANVDHTNLFEGDVAQLTAFLELAEKKDKATASILAEMNVSSKTDAEYHVALMASSNTYAKIIAALLLDANTIPASGGMAGVMAYTDMQAGPWLAPANLEVKGVSSLPIYISEEQQGNLNEDPATGKSINALRYFKGSGILVWGARTLDGNSQDWKYIQVRRTLIFIEQSCKQAAQTYVFQPNTQNTWEGVKAMIGSFLTSVWKEGGLMGAKPDEAFSVDCGLGATMTADDILNGFMRITVKVAVLHPAEFIVLTFEQQMVSS